MLLNENKTKLLIFGKDKLRVINNRLLNISINNTIIEPVDSCKNLGLFLDNNLRFESHVSSLIQKSFGKLRSLYIHKDILDTSIKLKLTDSLILSNISYCCSVYWPALIQKDKTSLQRVQNACLRFAYNVRKFDHITESLKKSKWLNLEERYQSQLLVLVKKVVLLNQPKYLYEKLIRGHDTHNINTRHKDLFTVPRHSSALFQRSFSYCAIKAFNKLPTDLKSSTLTNFKCKLKSYIHQLRDQR